MTGQSVKTLYHCRGWIESRVYPEIGSIKLSKLTVPQLQTFYQRIQEKDVPSAAVRVRTALNACLNRAVEVGITDRHPGRIARLKREEPNGLNDEKCELPGKRFLTIKEQETLVKQVEGTPLFFPVILGLYFGLRIAECCGLRWKDVDLEAKVIRIRWQVQRLPDGGGKKLIQLKTKNLVRTIPIPERLVPLFEHASITAGNPEGFVSPTQVGTPFTPQELSIPFKRHCVEAKINNLKGQPDCTHHDLRSTFLTRLANEIMVSPATLRAIAGHGKIDTTYRYYIQASKEDLREAMSRV
jgi:integrase